MSAASKPCVWAIQSAMASACCGDTTTNRRTNSASESSVEIKSGRTLDPLDLAPEVSGEILERDLHEERVAVRVSLGDARDASERVSERAGFRRVGTPVRCFVSSAEA